MARTRHCRDTIHPNRALIGSAATRRLRPRPLAALVPDRICPGGATRRQPQLCAGAVAIALSLCSIWGPAWSFVVVRLAPSLRKRRRLHRAGTLLLFSGRGPQQRVVVCAAGY